MKLALLNYNKGQMPKTMKEAIELSPYSRKDIESFLINDATLLINNNGYYFGICRKEFQAEKQEYINKRN